MTDVGGEALALAAKADESAAFTLSKSVNSGIWAAIENYQTTEISKKEAAKKSIDHGGWPERQAALKIWKQAAESTEL